MRVLFGFSNDDKCKEIVSLYEKKYKEKLEYKTVYYFKNLIEEVKKTEYNRVVVLEELERFPTNNYAQIDEYIFNNIDKVTDEFDSKNIIFIASDRRRTGDEFLTKLFNLGIYNVLTGQDRVMSKVSELIQTPRAKKDVKKYYEKSAGRNIYNTNEVSEMEIQKILAYYRNLEGNTDKYVETFNKVSEQYTSEQLRIIINFIPQEVRDYLTLYSDKYKAILELGNVIIPKMAQEPQTVLPREEEQAAQTVIEVRQEPQIIERIIVKDNKSNIPIVTEVMEKEVVRNIYEVPKDYKKIACFVGASKVGTTFCVNAIATHLTRKKVKTAIVDLAKKRDMYTLYTYDNEGKRAIAGASLEYASNGFNEPIVYDKILSVYTASPEEDRRSYNHSKVVDIVKQNNNVIMMDCDFTTPVDYFRMCQEIYVVQDMDLLNISQVTEFLKDLKVKGIPMNKVRIIINKHIKSKLTAKDIIEGIATYTSPDLRICDEIFPSSSIQYYVLPFDMDNYRKYIEMLFDYSNQFATFSKEFREEMEILANAIYPTGMTPQKANMYKKDKPGFFAMFKKMKSVSNGNDKKDVFEKEIK